jgi:hypothetical protein
MAREDRKRIERKREERERGGRGREAQAEERGQHTEAKKETERKAPRGPRLLQLFRRAKQETDLAVPVK